MGILARFKDIMASNINALLDKAEDPEKMIDQYLRNLNSDLGKVKSETAAVMAEEQRAKRALDECSSEIAALQNYAVKALEAGNDADARSFLEKKANFTEKEAGLKQAYELAHTNAEHMKELHSKLESDISQLNSRREVIRSKMAVARAQEKINDMTSSVADSNRSISAFERMEDKANMALDKANAMAELNKPADTIEDLKSKYDSTSAGSSVDDELAALKASLNKNN
ncbi:PspA/IM30 family protein [Anaerolentibacter hominis]|uniref:PspA/IM30 family protein n=1 Tax=Anaerolentibacter hominis TaxID=3079009 RepID=UPI0031B801F5